MAHIEGEIVIERLLEDVFDFVADERNEPRLEHARVELRQPHLPEWAVAFPSSQPSLAIATGSA